MPELSPVCICWLKPDASSIAMHVKTHAENAIIVLHATPGSIAVGNGRVKITIAALDNSAITRHAAPATESHKNCCH